MSEHAKSTSFEAASFSVSALIHTAKPRWGYPPVRGTVVSGVDTFASLGRMDIRQRGIMLATAIAAVMVAWNGAPVRATDAHRWPIVGAIVRTYQPPATDYGAGHRGIDVAAQVGDIVVSPIEGTVTFAGNLAGRGVITVSAGALKVTIEPVTSMVPKGTPVTAGRTIATVSGSGHCPETCAHIGVRIATRYADPFAVLGSQARAVLKGSGLGSAGGTGLD